MINLIEKKQKNFRMRGYLIDTAFLTHLDLRRARITSKLKRSLGFLKVILSCWLLLINVLQAKAQVPQTVVKNNYNNETEIKATNSVTLTDGFFVPLGKSVRIFTGMSFAECINLVSNPSANQNYIRTRVFKEPGVTEANIDAPRSVCNVNETIQYVDGLGRSSQIVTVQGSPTFKDVIQPIVYDAFGREDRKYLSYTVGNGNGTFRTDALIAQNNFYTMPVAGISSIPGAAFSETKYENSPLNRVEQKGAPGASWQINSGHTIKTDYGANTAEEVKVWTVGTNGASSDRKYGQGTLYKTIVKDENWVSGKTGTNEEFRDLEGQLVLKRQWETEIKSLSTYYIYDDLGNLKYVLPPALNENPDILPGGINSFAESDTQFDQYIFAYHHDGRKRIIEKKLPGKGWENVIYNKLDQVVLTQDSKQKLSNLWLFTKYDAFGRVVMTGVYTNASTRSILQTTVDGQVSLWETRTNGADYSSVAYPQSGGDPLTIYYYDNYGFPGNTFGVPSNDQASESRVNTLLTGTKTKILGSPTFLLKVQYYDKEARIVQEKSDNHLGGTDIIDNTYNFSGELISSNRTHKVNSVTTIIANRFEYDHMGRKKATMVSINGAAEVAVNKLDYNEVGQLIKKSLHSTDGQNFLQYTTFSYNERGWLKSSSADQFNLQLKYQDGTIPQYNGNISSQVYTNGASNTFNYTYDALNRLKSASAGNSLGEVATYDIMGNLKSLSRDNFGTNNYTNYNGNRLTTISGFINGNYGYDVNGNLTTDGPRNVLIAYNYLNLPEQVSGTQNITYTYDALGRKLKKQSASTGTTNYIDGIQYKPDGTIDFIQVSEGVARNNNGTYSFEYNLTDHLGNVRTTFYKNPSSQSLEILQRSDYYAFGKQRVVKPGINKFLYNGKELQEELGQLDYGMRFYDPEIARFQTIDPLADMSRKVSPYSYALNNPIRFVDVDGMYAGEAGNFKRGDKDFDDVLAYFGLNSNNNSSKKDDSKTENEEKSSIDEATQSNGPGPGKWDLLSEKSFKFKNIASNWRGARTTEIYFEVFDTETGTAYYNKFTLEIGVPKKSKDGIVYSVDEAVDKAALVANAVATQTVFVTSFVGPGGKRMMLNNATLPYYFATQMEAKLNNYIPGSKVSANTYQYQVKPMPAIYVNFFKGLLERLF
ncbi:sugar-binding protein [Pedobacter sp. HMWF019]|uniref:DUF6443 domain-containing protein n=1 Tax=Pedobacter sp. HMWF019 TaxID=2056856 RepID=UPI000D38D79A|nr:DUF6443 domain-containing protein [Pedobacter sp. HMWF019]PTT02576.1 sugar-binding protein [Pedobacter sp. HMWF019]